MITKKLAPGDPAPPFTLRDQSGRAVALDDLRGGKALVYFYPKALTPGCTSQSCALRDAAGELDGVAVVGVSPDPPERQRRFDEAHGLGFPLLADEDHAVAEAYGAWGERSMYGRRYQGIIRSAFLVDEAGRIEQAWYNIRPKDTVPKLLAALGR